MIFTRLLLVALYASSLAVFDIPVWCAPELALAFSVQAGLRARRNEDFLQAILLGLAAGSFSVEPWTLPVITCLVGALVASFLRQRTAPRSASMVALMAAIALLMAAGSEFVLRLSLPSLTLTLSGTLATFLRAMMSIPVVVMFDVGRPREAHRPGWR